MEKEKFIRVEHLEYLNAVQKNTPAYLETVKEVEVENRKYKVYHSKVVLLKGNYLEMVNANRKKAGMEPLSAVGSLPWGAWEIVNALIVHKGVKYLRYYRYDGDLQDKCTYIRDEEDNPVRSDMELYGKVMAAYNKDRKPDNKLSVCFNVIVDRIIELTTLDDDGDDDVPIIYYKEPDEPDFVKEKWLR